MKENPGLSDSIKAALEAIAILLIWLKLFYYLRIWDATNYLARMVV
jgi:hypothetical protein